MMPMERWDQEVLGIASELDVIAGVIQHPQHQQRRALVKLNHGVFQLQALLGNVLDKIVTLTQRSALLRPLERSLVHWGSVYAERVHNYYVRQVQQLGKHLWLRLIQTRLAGGHPGADQVDISDQHLVEMSVRRSTLLETERQLRQRQMQLQIAKGELRQLHDDYCAMQSNLDAAGSMSARLGSSPQEAFANPAVKGLGALVRDLANASRITGKNYGFMRDLGQNIAVQADRLISRCRNLVIDEVRYPKPESAPGKTNEYEQSLRHIQDLQVHMAHATQLLFQPPPTAHPILVKKGAFRGTTALRK